MDPVSSLKGILVQLSNEFNYYLGVFDLVDDGFSKRFALFIHKLVVRQLVFKICFDLVNGPQNYIKVKL